MAASSTCALASQRHRDMILCSNCEFASATSECDTCSNDSKEYLFCQNCRLLHLGTKGNFNHVFHDKNLLQNCLCSNCEISASKYSCLDCPVNDQNYCLGCSILHPRVKATRNHRIVRNENRVDNRCVSNLQLSSLLQNMCNFGRNCLTMTPISEFIEVLTFFDFPITNSPILRLMLPMMISGIGFFVFARRFIGRNSSSYLIIICTVALLRYIQTRPKSVRIL